MSANKENEIQKVTKAWDSLASCYGTPRKFNYSHINSIISNSYEAATLSPNPCDPILELAATGQGIRSIKATIEFFRRKQVSYQGQTESLRVKNDFNQTRNKQLMDEHIVRVFRLSRLCKDITQRIENDMKEIVPTEELAQPMDPLPIKPLSLTQIKKSNDPRKLRWNKFKGV